jgi:hypothetical protein
MVQKWIVQRNSPILFWRFRGVIDSNSLSTTSDINNNIIIATFNSLIKRQDESVWDDLYQSTLTLAKSFDISDVVDRLLESITPRKRCQLKSTILREVSVCPRSPE